MALDVGTRVGHYDVTALIGQGGRGEAYRQGYQGEPGLTLNVL